MLCFLFFIIFVMLQAISLLRNISWFVFSRFLSIREVVIQNFSRIELFEDHPLKEKLVDKSFSGLYRLAQSVGANVQRQTRPIVCRLVQTRLRKRKYRPIGGETTVFGGSTARKLVHFFRKITLATPCVRSAVSFAFDGASVPRHLSTKICETSGLFYTISFCKLINAVHFEIHIYRFKGRIIRHC